MAPAPATQETLTTTNVRERTHSCFLSRFAISLQSASRTSTKTLARVSTAPPSVHLQPVLSASPRACAIRASTTAASLAALAKVRHFLVLAWIVDCLVFARQRCVECLHRQRFHRDRRSAVQRAAGVEGRSRQSHDRHAHHCGERGRPAVVQLADCWCDLLSCSRLVCSAYRWRPTSLCTAQERNRICSPSWAARKRSTPRSSR